VESGTGGERERHFSIAGEESPEKGPTNELRNDSVVPRTSCTVGGGFFPGKRGFISRKQTYDSGKACGKKWAFAQGNLIGKVLFAGRIELRRGDACVKGGDPYRPLGEKRSVLGRKEFCVHYLTPIRE